MDDRKDPAIRTFRGRAPLNWKPPMRREKVMKLGLTEPDRAVGEDPELLTLGVGRGSNFKEEN